MRSLSDERWERYFKLVEWVGALPVAERASALSGLRERGEHPDVLALLAVRLSLPAEEQVVQFGLGLREVGDYRILRRLGEGGMGSVYLGYSGKDDQHVAIKVISDRLTSNQAYIDRFYFEARAGSALNHPNVVHTFATCQDRSTDRHYLVLEYVEGFTAHALLGRSSRLSVGDAAHIALDVARALEHVHSQGIIHRDIKPDNILITRSGVAKMADLGLAKWTGEAGPRSVAEHGYGTPLYMPYEQAIDAQSADNRSDLYALGVTLYHLVTGALPFPGEDHLEVVEKKARGKFPPASTLAPNIPPELDRILAGLLARLPRDRYQTVGELIVDLERSNLAARIPSFADPSVADPWVQDCRSSSGPTRLDLAVLPQSTG